MRPNRKDLRRLNSIQSMTANLQSAYNGLSEETKQFLLEGFTGETELHLRQFEQNISDTIEAVKKRPVKKSKYFDISGYWKDSGEEFSGYIVKEFDDIDESEEDKIFYYGLSEKDIKKAVENGKNTDLEFVITDYFKTETV